MDISMGLPHQDGTCFFPVLPPPSYNQSPKSHGAKWDWGGGGAVVPGRGFGIASRVGAVLAAFPLLPHSWGASPPAPGPSMRGARMVQGSCCHSTSVCRVLSQGDCVLVFTHLKQPVRSKYYLHTCFEHTDSRPSYTCSSFLAPAAVTHFLAISSCPLRRGRTRWVVFLVFTSSTRLILACIMAQS